MLRAAYYAVREDEARWQHGGKEGKELEEAPLLQACTTVILRLAPFSSYDALLWRDERKCFEVLFEKEEGEAKPLAFDTLLRKAKERVTPLLYPAEPFPEA